MINLENTKYEVRATNLFKKEYKRILKQGKDERKFLEILVKLANKEPLDIKYRNHLLQNSKKFRDCYECHISPDWLLIYQFIDEKLILLLVETGSHSDLF